MRIINLALNDIFFILLIVFMASQSKKAPLPPPDFVIETPSNEIPKSEKQEESGDDIPRLLIQVTAEGGLLVEQGTAVSIEDIDRFAKQKAASTVRLMIDKNTPYSIILRLSRTLSEKGYVLEFGG